MMNEITRSTSQAAIGIFDSGIGGLTVARCLQEQLPHETLCYFGDTARVPYGAKSPETVKRYSVEITQFLKSHDVKVIVAACNTVSSVALQEAQAVFPGPVLGVVEPGVRAAAAATKNGRIGVIGTKSTIKSAAYQDRLRALDPSFHITAQPCPLFVPLVEEDWVEHPVALQAAEQYLSKLRDEKIDVLILGCTHFPLLANVIQTVMGDSVTLVNSAEEVTREVAQYLQQNQLASQEKHWRDLFYASDDIAGFERMYHRFGGKPAARFVEAPSDFFQMVQQIHLYKDSVFTRGIQWFDDSLQN